ncbi:MAG: hypothetical protein V1655_01770 [bacterium]
MSWLIVSLFAYFLFSIVSLTDKFLLAGPPKPKIYAFYAGTLGSLIILLIPFTGLFIPDALTFFLCLLTGAIFVFSLLALYEGLEKYEASRVISAIGGLTPLFVFLLTFFIARNKEPLPSAGIFAFVLLASGSFLIARQDSEKTSKGGIIISALTAFLLALYFFLAKYVYLALPFWHGLIWIKIGSLFAAASFLCSKEVRDELFHKKHHKQSFNKKTGALFIINQVFGASAAILQNWAIALAGVAYVSIVVALQGVQYIFIFIFAMLLSWKFPKILKEKNSKKIITQKIIAIILIAAGLAILGLIS